MNRAELLKIAKPIIMKTWEVQATLDDRKTATRRLLKLPHCGYFENNPPRGVISPYQVGDILYVREKFNDTETDTILYAADKEFIDYGCKEVDGYLFTESEIKWKPSIHMPKEAARIFLRVTDVRVERLQDITEEQAIKEGIGDLFLDYIANCPGDKYKVPMIHETLSIDQYELLWDSLNKKRGYGWDANPWVWVIEFERVEIDG